jgi:hypothetical protein
LRRRTRQCTNGQIEALWINNCQASYEPARDGTSYRIWFAAVIDALSQT